MMSIPQIQHNACYTLLQKPMNKLYSINHLSPLGKPQVIAFTSKPMAKVFMKWVKDDERPKQHKHTHITLEPNKTVNLCRRCQLNGLELLIVDEQGNTCVQQSSISEDDLMFHLENTLLYYSP